MRLETAAADRGVPLERMKMSLYTEMSCNKKVVSKVTKAKGLLAVSLHNANRGDVEAERMRLGRNTGTYLWALRDAGGPTHIEVTKWRPVQGGLTLATKRVREGGKRERHYYVQFGGARAELQARPEDSKLRSAKQALERIWQGQDGERLTKALQQVGIKVRKR